MGKYDVVRGGGKFNVVMVGKYDVVKVGKYNVGRVEKIFSYFLFNLLFSNKSYLKSINLQRISFTYYGAMDWFCFFKTFNVTYLTKFLPISMQSRVPRQGNVILRTLMLRKCDWGGVEGIKDIYIPGRTQDIYPTSKPS